MSVKRSQSATRVLKVLEEIARNQPIGVSELARMLDDDKSAVQRAIMTLADSGWIRASSEPPTRWLLTAHILTIAHHGQVNNDLRLRAKATLEALRDQVGETVLLIVPDVQNFVVIDVIESRHMLRMVPHIGMMVSAEGSATSQTIVAHMTPEEQYAMLGKHPDQATLERYQLALQQGYAVSVGDVLEGTTNIAAPVIDVEGRAEAAVLVSGPSDRLTEDKHASVGQAVAQAGRQLSRGSPKRAGY